MKDLCGKRAINTTCTTACRMFFKSFMAMLRAKTGEQEATYIQTNCIAVGPVTCGEGEKMYNQNWAKGWFRIRRLVV